MSRPVALVRDVPASFARCLVRAPDRPAFDLERARSQHRAYVAALERGGFATVRVEAVDDAPDACFVEDALVVLGSLAIATRPGAPSRRVEVETVVRAFRAQRPDATVVRLEAPATLDGGDVLRIGRRLFVGRSRRTNAAGAAALAARASREGVRVTEVPVAAGLHLKSAVTAVDCETVLLDPSAVEGRAFEGFERIEVAAGEGAGANVVRLEEGGRLLAASAFPRTNERLRAAGHEVVEVDLTEFTAADAGPTCLSIRLRGGDLPRPSAGAE